jgi:hypothetical protein
LKINVRELRFREVSEQWLCLLMAINLGNLSNLGNWNISATGFHPEISLKRNHLFCPFTGGKP